LRQKSSADACALVQPPQALHLPAQLRPPLDADPVQVHQAQARPWTGLSRRAGTSASCADDREERQPRPTNGIFAAIPVRASTWPSSGSLAMNTTARATHSTSMVGSGAVSPLACNTPPFIRAVISVSALPTSICPHATSYLRPSRAVDFVRPVMACLLAVYGAEYGRGVCAEMEPLLMIRPPRGVCSFISRIASCVQRNVPVRFTAITRLHCSNERSSSGTGGAPLPALLNKTSSRPNASFVRAKSSRTDAGSLTSAATARARSASGPASARVCS